ncbi:hypothetical protein M404DRAFT_541897 [Pisolithus tinctorius Marx 270]|uniref:Uncharacterized protein n=1 Tax=Pisolithus tinctorius Marx 270 TaxID=870435 RepID=A0A0C3K5S5_PISTI|nr:hypothetical protein M404DRAFT_541897 [Pisolithus tinctorius Marx 270]
MPVYSCFRIELLHVVWSTKVNSEPSPDRQHPAEDVSNKSPSRSFRSQHRPFQLPCYPTCTMYTVDRTPHSSSTMAHPNYVLGFLYVLPSLTLKRNI